MSLFCNGFVMLMKGFQHVLQKVKSELFVAAAKLPLPKREVGMGFDTPYLRRRMQNRLRRLYG